MSDTAKSVRRPLFWLALAWPAGRLIGWALDVMLGRERDRYTG